MTTDWMVLDSELDERPRERLMRGGAESLSDAELVAILLRTGRRGVPAVELARALLRERGGLAGMVGMESAEVRTSGIGPAKRATLCAALEIGCRLARSEVDTRPVLGQPAAVARYLHLRYRRAGQEVLGALYLDARQRPIRDAEIFRGTLDRAAAEPRAILKQAIVVDAKGFVLFHTHPSGDPSPSAQDLVFTDALKSAGKAVGIELLDHLIVGDGGRWVSLRERGGW